MTQGEQMVKITYRVFGVRKEYTASVDLQTTDDLIKLTRQHVTSTKATLWNDELPDVTIDMVSNGTINTFVYNKGADIVNFINSPSVINKGKPSFPVKVTKEFREGLEYAF